MATNTRIAVIPEQVPSEEEVFVKKQESVETDIPPFEKVLEKLGNFGKFQFIQCVLCVAFMMHACFASAGFVFIGYTPPHECNKVNETQLLASYNLLNDSTALVSYGQCDITVSTNQSGRSVNVESLSCPNGWLFPDGKHQTLVSEWELVCDKTGYVELTASMPMITAIIGGFVASTIADRVGRKFVLCVCTIIKLGIETTMIFSPNEYFYLSAQVIAGIVDGGLSGIYLVIGMESLVARHRPVFGVAVCLYYIACCLGAGLVAYLLQDLSWRYYQTATVATGLTIFLMPFFLSESPRWLAIHERSKEALQILKRACRQNGKDFAEVKKAFEEYMVSISHEKQGKHCNTAKEEGPLNSSKSQVADGNRDGNKAKNVTLLSMLTRRDTLRLLLVMWYIWTVCYVTYYGILMSSSSLAGNRFLNFCLMILVEIPANFLLLYMMNRMGRILILRIFLAIATFSLLISVLHAHFDNYSNESEIVTLVMFNVGRFAITCFYNLLYTVTPEIFPTVFRSAGNASCKSVAKIGYMLAPYTRPLHAVAKWAPGLIFCSMCFIALPLTLLIPETKDKILPTQLGDIRTRKEKSDKISLNQKL